LIFPFFLYLYNPKMEHQAYQLSISSLSVGTWLQTLVFYFILFLMFNVILAQLNLSPFKLWLNFGPKRMEGQLDE